MEEKYNNLRKNPELLAQCANINQLVRKRELLAEPDLRMSSFSIKEVEDEIAYQQLQLQSFILSQINKDKGKPVKDYDKHSAEKMQEVKTEIPPVNIESLFNKKAEEVFYYTIIAKDLARKEMPDLVDVYPDHFYYAIICIEAEDGQYVKIAQDETGKMPYYPGLDQAQTQKERICIMNEFLDGLPDRYIHAKYEDLFGE